MACVLERSGLFAAAYRGLVQPLLAPICGDEAASLAFAICFVGFWWVLAWGMARRGWRVVI
jgi:predicted acyltransferase